MTTKRATGKARVGTRPDRSHTHAILDGAAAPTGSPIALPATGWQRTFPARHGNAAVRWSG
jgi:hypothetical protein